MPEKAGVIANTLVTLKRAAARGDGETRNGISKHSIMEMEYVND